jgi:hypothetical protein
MVATMSDGRCPACYDLGSELTGGCLNCGLRKGVRMIGGKMNPVFVQGPKGSDPKRPVAVFVGGPMDGQTIEYNSPGIARFDVAQPDGGAIYYRSTGAKDAEGRRIFEHEPPG